MPARDRLSMTFTLKQFLPSGHLRVISVLNLEPRRALAFDDVVPKAMLRNDAFQLQFANTLEERCAVLLDAHQHHFSPGRQRPGIRLVRLWSSFEQGIH